MLKIVFHEPLIPPNTGNAIRMVAGTGAQLHLVEPLGFDLTDKHLRRAGLDYHDLAQVFVHHGIDAAWEAIARPPARVYAFTAHADRSLADVRFAADDVLLFGSETTGLPGRVLTDPHVTACVRIPMLPGRRSMNLSNAAAVACYEAWRQSGYPGGV